MSSTFNRRDFLKLGGLGLVPATIIDPSNSPKKSVEGMVVIREFNISTQGFLRPYLIIRGDDGIIYDLMVNIPLPPREMISQLEVYAGDIVVFNPQIWFTTPAFPRSRHVGHVDYKNIKIIGTDNRRIPEKRTPTPKPTPKQGKGEYTA